MIGIQEQKTYKFVIPIILLLTIFTQNCNNNFFDIDICNNLFINTIMEKSKNHYVELLTSKIQKYEKKDWTVLIYIAADNDLAPFAIRNIKQMAKIGSTKHLNIIVQLDIRKAARNKITRRFLIKKGQVIHLNADDPTSQKMDSGDPETLISFCKWGIDTFPATHFGLVLWNHGTGALDPVRGRIVKTEELFSFNPKTLRLELDRSIGYIDRMLNRGICWDDTTGNYLNNKKLNYALDTICNEILGEKFYFIGFDACLMQMIEVANIVKNYANVMIGSQEAELGYGWHYADLFEPFTIKSMEPVDLAKQIVNSFGKSYEKITNDYTLSAINLNTISLVEENINNVAFLLINGLKQQKNNYVKKTISASRNKKVCTHFDEPSYIDLYHFYSNLISNMRYIKLQNKNEEEKFKSTLTNLLTEGKKLIENSVISNTTGNNLSLAKGISIYFPEKWMHSSYKNLIFADENEWIQFIRLYLAS